MKLEEMLEVTEAFLNEGLALAKAGWPEYIRYRMPSRHAKKRGFSIVREYVGHGVGPELHEGPRIPNYGFPEKAQV